MVCLLKKSSVYLTERQYRSGETDPTGRSLQFCYKTRKIVYLSRHTHASHSALRAQQLCAPYVYSVRQIPGALKVRSPQDYCENGNFLMQALALSWRNSIITLVVVQPNLSYTIRESTKKVFKRRV